MLFFKKKESVVQKMHKSSVNTAGEPLDKLNSEGELPFGWVAHNKEFTDNINVKWNLYIQLYIASKKKSQLEQYAVLKYYIKFLEESHELCKSKGECFEKWFNDCVVDQEFIDKLKNELNNMK